MRRAMKRCRHRRRLQAHSQESISGLPQLKIANLQNDDSQIIEHGLGTWEALTKCYHDLVFLCSETKVL